MIWIVLALVIFVATCVYQATRPRSYMGDRGWAVFLTGVGLVFVTLLLNAALMGVGAYEKTVVKCDLAPVTAGSSSYAAVTNQTFYYRCEGDSNFAPTAVAADSSADDDDYQDVKVFYSAVPHVHATSVERSSHFWSVFSSGSEVTRIYLPNNLIATTLDTAGPR